MYCQKCGAQIEDGSAFCPKCGASQNGGANLALQQTKPRKPVVFDVFAYIAFTIALIGVCLCWLPVVPFVFGVPSVVLAIVGGFGNRTGVARAALILGLICTVLAFIFWFRLLALI